MAAMRKITEMVTSKDLPLFLQSTIDATVQAYYRRVQSQWRRYTVTDTVPDFNPVTFRRIYTDDELDLILEGEPYREGQLHEDTYSWKVAKYGKLLKVTYEALVNDDARQLRQMASQYGRMIAELEPKLVAEFLDGLAISLDTAAAPLSGIFDEALIEEAMLAFRTQTNENGRRIVAIPRFLVVSPKWLNTAITLLRPSTPLDFNILGGALEIIEEPYLVNEDHAFIFADPQVMPAVEVDYLAVPGDNRENYSNGPRTFWEGGEVAQALPSQVGLFGEGFRYDTLNYKVRHVLGIGSPDPRAVFKIEFTG